MCQLLDEFAAVEAAVEVRPQSQEVDAARTLMQAAIKLFPRNGNRLGSLAGSICTPKKLELFCLFSLIDSSLYKALLLCRLFLFLELEHLHYLHSRQVYIITNSCAPLGTSQ